jgi:hypothetical protein
VDPRGSSAEPLSEADELEGSPLEQLAAASGREFPNLLKARVATREGLETRRAALGQLPHDDDVAVVLMGSWGRAEVTAGSDDDFMILVRGANREGPRPSIEDVKTVLDRAPGDQGIFGEPVASEQLIENIGLNEDTNSNLTRRMLLLLESVYATREDLHETVTGELVDRYLDESVKDFRVPRFLLNDVVRYWRTMCVDFAGKERKGPEKWGIRNAKLRTSRKVLFAGGLLPVFECSNLAREEMPEFLRDQLRMPPTDRIAYAFLAHNAPDSGGRALGAYDDFLGLLDDNDFRDELESVTRDTSKDLSAFQEAARLGKELERGLLALLFETESLPKLARDYIVF